jgi:hypothetical protein
VNRDDAKVILLLHRPGIDDAAEAETAEALGLAESDVELRGWFERHCAMQAAVLDSFARLEAPEGLKEQIVSETRARLRANSARRTVVAGALVAALILLFAGIEFWPGTSGQNSFDRFRNRMVGDVQRAYPQMDLETSNPSEIRSYLASRGNGDFAVPPGLENTKPTGCKLLRWHNQPVTMICYNSGRTADPKTPDLFLFVVDRSAVKMGRGGEKAFETVGNLATATWTEKEKVYLLAGSGDQKFLKGFL